MILEAQRCLSSPVAVLSRVSTTERVLPSAPEFCSERHEGGYRSATKSQHRQQYLPLLPVLNRVQFHFLHGNSKAQGCALLGENVRSHKACAWAEDPAQTPPHLNTHCQLKCLSCPVTHVPSHGPGRRSNSCSGRGQETLAGRSGGVSVKCFTINDKKLQKFRSALNQ